MNESNMEQANISFPGYMERCVGFSIPQNGRFYVVSFDDLILFDIDNDTAEELECIYDIDMKHCLIRLEESNKTTIPFIGLWGGTPLLHKKGIGDLSLKESKVTLRYERGFIQEWQFENLSGDWEHVTFDSERNAFLFGTPYDVDFKYIHVI